MVLDAKGAAPFNFAAKEVIVGNLPVDAGVSAQAFFITDSIYCCIVLVHGSSSRFLLGVADLGHVAVVVIDAGEDIHAACTVIHIKVGILVIEVGPAQGLGVVCAEVEAEAVALAADCLNAHNGTHCSVILCSGVGYYFDALDFVALKAGQLSCVSHLTPVYIYQRGALADNLQAILAGDKTGGPGQYVIGGADILQHRAAHIGLQSFSSKFDYGHHCRNSCALQHLSVFDEGNQHAVHGGKILCAVTEHGHHHYTVSFTCYYIECAVFQRHCAADYARVGF